MTAALAPPTTSPNAPPTASPRLHPALRRVKEYDLCPEITKADLMEAAEQEFLELVDGQLVEKPGMSMESSHVTMRFTRRLLGHLDEHPLGILLESQTSYQCFPHKPSQIRRPNLSFIRGERITSDMFRGHVPIAPDLAVEVISFRDNAEEIQKRLQDFLRAGTPLVIAIYPTSRSAWVYREGGTATLIDEGGVLDCDPVLPGFTCQLADLFAGLPDPELLPQSDGERERD